MATVTKTTVEVKVGQYSYRAELDGNAIELYRDGAHAGRATWGGQRIEGFPSTLSRDAEDLLNHAITDGPVSLPDAVAMLDTAYLGHVIVLWSWALKQPNPESIESATVRFRSLDGRDREMAVPRLAFTEPITTLAGAAS